MRRDGATTYFDKSNLGLHQHPESPIQIVKRVLDEQTEESGDAELLSIDLSTLRGRTKYDTRNGI